MGGTFSPSMFILSRHERLHIFFSLLTSFHHQFPPSNPGNHNVKDGTNATTTTITIPTIKYGARSFSVSSIRILAIRQDTNKDVPTGGVNKPIASVHNIIMEKCKIGRASCRERE